MEGRTKVVVSWLVFLQIFALSTLSNNLSMHFWDGAYAQNKLQATPPNAVFGNRTALIDVLATYHSPPRQMWFVPHVWGAVVWWNGYWLQLVPAVRRSYPTVHRWLGRLLLLAGFAQTISGVGMACTSHSAVIRIFSVSLASAVVYVLYNAWYYARQGDFVRHKYWAYRLVGYLQAITSQRFWFMVLILLHASGVHVLYSPFDATDPASIDRTVLAIFDGSFILALVSSLYVTEWYLSGNNVGMLDPPNTRGNRTPRTGTTQREKES